MFSAAGYVAYLFFQKDWLHKTGHYFLIAGFLFHGLAFGYDFVESGYFPVNNLHKTLVFAVWTLAGAFLIFQYIFNVKILGIYAAPLVTFVMIATLKLPMNPVKTKTILTSFWLFVHIVGVFIGEACFTLACGIGFLYLVQEHAIKTKTHGFFFTRLPSLQLLDRSGYACIIAGFTILSVGLLSGFVYAGFVYGKFWGRDPRVIWSGITWLVYAVLLHQRFALGWRGRRAALMAILGFATLLFTFHFLWC
jgi:cytochrome c-type biogenesis protein CcsB